MVYRKLREKEVVLLSEQDKYRSKKDASKAIFETPASIEFLSKLWAQFKKQLKKDYEISVAAVFKKDNDNNVVCTFFLDNAYAEQKKIDTRKYNMRFDDSFDYWIMDWSDLIERISCDLSIGKEENEILYEIFPHKKRRDAKKASKK